MWVQLEKVAFEVEAWVEKVLGMAVSQRGQAWAWVSIKMPKSLLEERPGQVPWSEAVV